jgi:hypothetical protein
MPHLIFSAKNLAYRLDLDPRTAAGRIAKLQLEPFAVSVTGEAFFLEDALHRLQEDELKAEAEPQPQEAESL